MLSFRRAKGLATTGLLAGVLLAKSGIALAQDVVPIPPAVPTATAEGNTDARPQARIIRVQAANPANPVFTFGSQQPPSQPGQAAPSSPWSKVPPTEPTPRPGLFIVPPSGPGYYSAFDLVHGNYVEKAPAYPYRGVCYDNDFRYLDKPDNQVHDFFDPVKRIHLGDDWLLSLGGEERVRYMHEHDGYVRLTGVENDYTLFRSRLYADLWYKDCIRFYAEFIDAQITGEDLAPLPIDVNHSDFLNLFFEVKLAELCDNPVYVRVGRQELLYGSQRLISPLDWANTRRTFQGVKGYWHSDKLDVDAFWVQPIIVSPNHFDSPDSGRQFAGLWTTYRPVKSRTIDAYYLYLDSTRPVAVGRSGVGGGYNVSTFGSRYSGDYQHFLWDFEGMYQFGDWSNQGITAGAYTTGLGYQFACLPMNPQFWVYQDWASGDHNPAGFGNLHGTFNQLFPFGHYYFGYLDLVGRQNIDDFNMQVVLFPAKWLTAGIQYHMFRLDSARDALYNSAGTAIRRDPTGAAGTDVGDEIDLFAVFHLSLHQDILLGYSKLFAGEFIRRTGAVGSPELFYAQYSYKW
ncbi:MAG TPA: alginate export family protein [Gemmataceae bacterium]|nr:alginate export family protein [Gemmataceae bacterium]